MAVETDADRAIFVNPDDFGTTGLYTLTAGGSSDLDGIFSDPLARGAGGNAAAALPYPAFLCVTSALPAGAARGDTLTIGARAFRVVQLHDQAGMTLLELS